MTPQMTRFEPNRRTVPWVSTGRLRRIFRVSAMLLGLTATASHATRIDYTVFSKGNSLWEYEYELTQDDAALSFDGLSIYFDAQRALVTAFYTPLGWQGMFVLPEPTIPADGFLDLVHTDGPVPPGIHRFTAVVRYEQGTPGAQAYDLYLSAPFFFVSTGFTQTVPEPGTWMLLLSGLVALRTRRPRPPAAACVGGLPS